MHLQLIYWYFVVEKFPKEIMDIPNNQFHQIQLEIDGFDERLMMNGQVSSDLKGRILQNVAGNGDFEGRFRVVSRQDRHLLALLSSSRAGGLEICRVFPRN